MTVEMSEDTVRTGMVGSVWEERLGKTTEEVAQPGGQTLQWDSQKSKDQGKRPENTGGCRRNAGQSNALSA